MLRKSILVLIVLLSSLVLLAQDKSQPQKQGKDDQFRIKVETVEDPKQIELDASQAQLDEPRLQENFGIPVLQRLK